MARSNNDAGDEFHFKQGACNIIVKKGDLLFETDVDVIVIPTPDRNETNPDSFQIFKHLSSQMDANHTRDIQKLRSELKPLNPEIFSKTDRAFMFVIPPYIGNLNKAQELLRKTYTSCLNLAVKNKFRTIAFPTIGCGIIGFATLDAARLVYLALEHFGQTKDASKMDEIRIVIYDNSIWKDFTTVFVNLSVAKDSKIKLIETKSKNPNPSEMSSRWNEKSSSRGQTSTSQQDDYEDDFETDPARHQRGNPKEQTSNLNPNTPDFQPKQGFQRRVLRRYHINKGQTELHILQGDILRTKVDAIVNAANESMLGGGGVDGIIHKAAGDELRKACKRHKEIYRDVRLPTGRSRILLSYNMSATTYYIINTAGPRYDDHEPEEAKNHLISCYETSLALANLYDLETVAFTAISCGIFGYPLGDGAETALKAVDQYAESMKRILFVLKDDEIYDAWVQKARQLKFVSLDGDDNDDTVSANTSKQPPTSNKSNKMETKDANDERSVSNQSPPKARKEPERSNPNSERETSNQGPALSVIDASTSDNTANANDPKGEIPADNASSNRNKNPGSSEAVSNEGDNDVEDKYKKSNNKKNDNKATEKTSNPSPESKSTQNKNQKPTGGTIQKEMNKSLIDKSPPGDPKKK